jgi:hypothetical protein
MANNRTDSEDIEFTDAELDMFGDYTDALLAQKNPDMVEYLARCPGSEAKLRPILETSQLLDREITQFRRKYPHVDLGKLLDLKHKTGKRRK